MKSKMRTTTLVLLAMSVIAIASLAPTAAASCYWNDREYGPVWLVETASQGEVDFKSNGSPHGICYVSVHGVDVPPQ